MSYSFPTAASGSLDRLNTTALNVGSGNPIPVTVAMWVKFPSGISTSVNTQPIFFLVSPPYTKWLHLHIVGSAVWSGGKSFLMQLENAGAFDSAGSNTITGWVDDGNWHHIAAVWEGASTEQSLWKLYIDGIQSISATSVQTGTNDYNLNVTDFWCGKAFGETPVNKQAEIGIWKAALSAGDITELYTNKKAPILVQNSTLRHYWSLRQTGGLTDQKGTSNLAIVAGSPTADADHPAGIVDSAGTLKHDIPTTDADGTARKVFIWTDASLATLLVNGVAVTASGGHYKLSGNGAVLATTRPAALVSYGSDATTPASGGVCWAAGISE